MAASVMSAMWKARSENTFSVIRFFHRLTVTNKADNAFYSGNNTKRLFSTLPSEGNSPSAVESEEEFRVFEIKGLKKVTKKEEKKAKWKEPPPPRFLQMPVDQDWTNIWPAASSFKWSVVPFPVRQGFVKNNEENEGIIPGKYANAELMKIPNFLHLTPAHIQKHCQAIKKFCTPWPDGLESDEKCEKYFPLEIRECDYLHSGPSVRHPKSHIVRLQFRLSSLELDYHARDKFIRLVGDRYDEKTDTVTIEADRCPLKKQNYDYLMYVLTALYNESWKSERWEMEKTEADWEKYFWDLSASRRSAVDLLQRFREVLKDENACQDIPAFVKNMADTEGSEEDLVRLESIQEFKDAVTALHNDGEDNVTLRNYKNSVVKMMGLKPLPSR